MAEYDLPMLPWPKSLTALRKHLHDPAAHNDRSAMRYEEWLATSLHARRHGGRGYTPNHTHEGGERA